MPNLISLPLLEIIRYARLYTAEVKTLDTWPEKLYKLIGREDV